MKYGICDHCRELTEVDDNAEWQGMQAQLCEDCCGEAESQDIDELES